MSVSDHNGSVCIGTFKSFGIDKGWGFLKCEDFPEDVFVSVRTSPNLRRYTDQGAQLTGQGATFTVVESVKNPGTYEAHGVELINSADITYGAARKAKPGSWGSNPGDWVCGACGDTNFAKNTECRSCGQVNPNLAALSLQKASWDSSGGIDNSKKSSVADHNGSLCIGMFKSFGVDKGWGFLKSADFPEDVFVSVRTSPNLRRYTDQGAQLPGQPATFTVVESVKNPGTYEAHGVELINSSSLTYGAAPKAKQGSWGSNPGDWVCRACGDTNFAKNTECRSCGAPNPNPVVQPTAQANSPYGCSGGNTNANLGSKWVCPQCGFTNMPANQVCGGNGPLGCKAPRPAGAGTGSAGSAGDGSGEAAQMMQMFNMMTNMMGGDMNAMSAMFGTMSAMTAMMGADSGGFSGCKGKGKGKMPEWVCPQCGFKNHDKNQVCGGSGPMGCKAPRPTGNNFAALEG